MSTGPEHYRVAERLLDELGSVELGSRREAALLAEAQVHATLALAAAAGNDPGVGGGIGRSPGDAEAWLAIADPQHAEVLRAQRETGAES